MQLNLINTISSDDQQRRIIWLKHTFLVLIILICSLTCISSYLLYKVIIVQREISCLEPITQTLHAIHIKHKQHQQVEKQIKSFTQQCAHPSSASAYNMLKHLERIVPDDVRIILFNHDVNEHVVTIEGETCSFTSLQKFIQSLYKHKEVTTCILEKIYQEQNSLKKNESMLHFSLSIKLNSTV